MHVVSVILRRGGILGQALLSLVRGQSPTSSPHTRMHTSNSDSARPVSALIAQPYPRVSSVVCGLYSVFDFLFDSPGWGQDCFH